MVVAAKGVTYQSCEVDLGKKTQWHIDINGGMVPVFELPNGAIITESKVQMDFLEGGSSKSLPDILQKSIR